MINLQCLYVSKGSEKRGVLLAFLAGSTKVVGIVKVESGHLLSVPLADIKVVK